MPLQLLLPEVVWPPHIKLTNRTTLAAPWYMATWSPPVAVGVRRQLFMDEFLLRGGGATNATVTFHAPTTPPRRRPAPPCD